MAAEHDRVTLRTAGTRDMVGASNAVQPPRRSDPENLLHFVTNKVTQQAIRLADGSLALNRYGGYPILMEVRSNTRASAFSKKRGMSSVNSEDVSIENHELILG